MIAPVPLLAIVLLVILGMFTPAYAQQVGDNQVFLGQTGDTNTIRIDQAGNGNVAGSDGMDLQLNQFGRNNTLEVDQVGLFNQGGSDPRASGNTSVVRGTNQVGTRNQIAISQTIGITGIGNRIGSVLQIAPDLGTLTRALVANFVAISQTENDGPHRVGQVVQTTDSANGPTNLVRVTQTGGLQGIGNSILGIFQSGSGNRFTSIQTQSANMIGATRQLGGDNVMSVEQADGSGNAIDLLDQSGGRNTMLVGQHDNRNVLSTASQSNDGVAIAGNRMVLSLSGNDNGGNGVGVVGSFSGEAAGAGVLQASARQIGDDNDLSYVVASSNGVTPLARRQDTMLNLYGFIQQGDQNGLIGTVTGAENQVAVRQEGDGNELSFSQSGISNNLAALQTGERNRADLQQRGNQNSLRLSLQGDDNNKLGAAFSQSALLDVGLVAGTLRQLGDDNQMGIDVIGNLNLLAVLQSGTGNSAFGRMVGSGNQASLSQLGDDNIVAFTQAGSANILSVQQ